jgi:hypothetical protein
MSSRNVTKTILAEQIRDLIAGTQKHPANGSFTFAGGTYTGPTLIQLFQSMADALVTADSAKAAWEDALKNASDVRGKVGPVIKAYRTWLVATYGNAPALLADYGLSPRKVAKPLSTDEQAQAIAKREATRAARHTMGTQQRKKVKGVVPTTAPVTSAPVPTAPSPAAPETPATPVSKTTG